MEVKLGVRVLVAEPGFGEAERGRMGKVLLVLVRSSAILFGVERRFVKWIDGSEVRNPR